VSAANDLLRDYQHVIAEVALVTGSRGVFDVVVDGETLFSKRAAGRHAEPGEVLGLFRDRHASGVPVYGDEAT
jgi:selenoprotein W-related protein